MKVEYEREREKRRWSVEVDSWVDRFLIAVVVLTLFPGVGVALSRLTLSSI
ncbi:MAG TPA: hypothetical protein VLI94_07565 [Solirubrobacterales bacterium]|nr:hypothetical protein [Solirubrobacterales bacterium]